VSNDQGEKRVILVKPGDVLVVGGVGYGSPRQATEAIERFEELTGIRPVWFFSGAIEIDQLSTDQLRDLLKRAEDQSAVGGPQKITEERPG